jgi:bla regulator protein blaR1
MNLLTIAALSSSLQTEFGAPLANHLWQSTVFAGVGWLLTLLLRKNRAQARYLLWLIASAKFLLPFSLLIRLGSHLALLRTPAVPQPRLFLAMEAIGQPFSPGNLLRIPAGAPPSMLQVALRNFPIFLLMAWLGGCVAVLLTWYLRWRRLRIASREGLPAKSGRELDALRRAERSMQSLRPISLILSRSALEPGILGVLRQILILPAGISDRLTDAQFDSILAHELCHVRRRDNLAAALHMLVEALFWFHPLVWWMGARLVDERERACDEEVLRLGADPHAYAESILKVCKFYLESPLFCAAGVTGSNLKKRIEAIMSNHVARNLEWSKKLLLSTMGVAVVFGPIVFGLLHASQSSAQAQAQSDPAIVPAFESVSIKPNTNSALVTPAAPASPVRCRGCSHTISVAVTGPRFVICLPDREKGTMPLPVQGHTLTLCCEPTLRQFA